MTTQTKRRSRVSYEENHKFIEGVEHKKCSICTEWLPMNKDYYYKNKSCLADSFNPYCKKCTIEKSKKYQDENPDKHNESQKKYLYTTEKGRETRRRNLDIWITKGGYREWQRNNKDKLYEYGQKRNMNKKHDITDQEWLDCLEFFKDSCAYCGLPEAESYTLFGQQLHREHVDHNGANDITNCVPACKSCNGLKNTFELNEWYNPDNPAYSKRRYNRIIKWLLSFTKKD